MVYYFSLICFVYVEDIIENIFCASVYYKIIY